MSITPPGGRPSQWHQWVFNRVREGSTYAGAGLYAISRIEIHIPDATWQARINAIQVILAWIAPGLMAMSTRHP